MQKTSTHNEQHDAFSEKARSMLEHYEVPVDNDCWKEINQQLPQPVMRRLRPWLVGAAIIAVAAVILYAVLSSADAANLSDGTIIENNPQTGKDGVLSDNNTYDFQQDQQNNYNDAQGKAFSAGNNTSGQSASPLASPANKQTADNVAQATTSNSVQQPLAVNTQKGTGRNIVPSSAKNNVNASDDNSLVTPLTGRSTDSSSKGNVNESTSSYSNTPATQNNNAVRASYNPDNNGEPAMSSQTGTSLPDNAENDNYMERLADNQLNSSAANNLFSSTGDWNDTIKDQTDTITETNLPYIAQQTSDEEAGSSGKNPEDDILNSTHKANTGKGESFTVHKPWQLSAMVTVFNTPDLTDYAPLGFGVSMRRGFNRFDATGLEVGVVFSGTRKNYITDASENNLPDVNLRATYGGFNVNIFTGLWNRNPIWNVYLKGGFQAELGSNRIVYYSYTNEEIREESGPNRDIQGRLSLNGAVGGAVNLREGLAIFCEPTFSYYFSSGANFNDNNTNNNSFIFSLTLGVRYDFNK